MFARLIAILIISITIISCSKETITPERDNEKKIYGKLLGFDNKPMESAHVHASLFSDQVKKVSVEVNEDGSFEIPFSNGVFVELEFTGVNHFRARKDFFLFDVKKDLELKIQLVPNILTDDLSKVSVIGNFNKFSFSKDLVPMQIAEDGTYFADVPNTSDTLYYQILNAVQGERSVNGQMSHGYTYDGGGDYRSFIVSTDSLIRVTFTPDKLPNGDFEFSLICYDANINSYLDLENDINEVTKEASKKYRTTKNFKAYFETIYEYLLKQNELENLPESSKFYLAKEIIEISYRLGTDIDKDLIYYYLNIIPITSAYWANNLMLLLPALDVLNNEGYKNQFIQKMLTENKSDEVQMNLLQNLIEFYAYKQDKDSQTKYFNMLIENYPDAGVTKYVKKRYSPDKKIQTGNPLPEFSFENLDKPGEMITNKTLEGKLWLVDVWATWCGPCVGEMEHLHKVYRKFKNKNFSMYSISIDSKKEDIAKFRKGKWKMPWLHSFTPEVWDSKVVELFEVSGVPQPMLIGPDGNILELGSGLRGEELEKTIDKYLK